MTIAWANRDGQAYLDLHHEDFQMTWHSTGRVSKKGDTSAEQMSAIMGLSTIRNLARYPEERWAAVANGNRRNSCQNTSLILFILIDVWLLIS